jgi:hypothetical protein
MVRIPALRAVNLLLRFLIELAALAGLAFWGATAGHTTTGKIVLALATPLAAAWLWGMYAAPASRHRLDGPARLAVEWSVLGGGAIATAVAGQPWVAVAFLVLAVINAVLLARTAPPPRAHSAGSCQCCSSNAMSEMVSVTGSAAPADSDQTTAPSAATGSAATPRG